MAENLPGFNDGQSSISSKIVSDWNLCILCQNDTGEVLVCPSNTKRQNSGAGYSSLADNRLSFKELGSLPTCLNLNQIDEGHGLCNALSNHEAKWHKKCRDMFNSTKILRLSKRKSRCEEQDIEEDISKRTRSLVTCDHNPDEKTCFSVMKLSLMKRFTKYKQ